MSFIVDFEMLFFVCDFPIVFKSGILNKIDDFQWEGSNFDIDP